MMTKTKEEILKEIKATLGIVPGFFETMPAASIEAEWHLFKRATLEKNVPIGFKERELIGLGIAATRLCEYCVEFHKGLARLHGATDEEIDYTLSLVGFGGRYSSLLKGSSYDFDKFMKELKAIAEFLRKK